MPKQDKTFIEQLQQQIQERIEVLKPLMDEYTRLERADKALSEALTDPPKKRRGRPPKLREVA